MSIMKTLFLFLAILQAAPQVPRRAANNPAGSGETIQGQPAPQAQPSPGPPVQNQEATRDHHLQSIAEAPVTNPKTQEPERDG
jgi:hypothetical protein